jgi:uncharacterized RDD family membrane protein YckC
MMVAGGTSGQRCGRAGCAGRPATAGRCLSHVDDGALRALLAEGRPDKPLDCKRATIDAGLVQRLVNLAPRDRDGRPALPAIDFSQATFGGLAAFDGVRFTADALFDRAVFRHGASFDGTIFEGHARFGAATFASLTGFPRARFEGHAWFSSASFAAATTFEETHFGAFSWFGGATFTADVVFNRATFLCDAFFDETVFGCHASFAETVFERDATLAASTFANEALYDGARFEGPRGAPFAASSEIEWTGASLATWGDRAKAAVIDLTVPAGLLFGALVLSMLLPRLNYYGMTPYVVGLAMAGGTAYIVRNLIRQGHTGQTIGKERLGLTLVHKNDGLPVGVRASLVRYALHTVDTVPGFTGWLLPLWSPTRQTFADQIATTVVARQRGWAGAVPTVRPVAVAVPAAGFG